MAECFQVGGIDHQLVRRSTLSGQTGEDPVEHTKAAPADEAVVDRLGRPIGCGCVTPAQAVADHEDDPADDAPVVHARDAMRERKVGLDPGHLLIRQPEQITHRRILRRQ